MLVACFLGNKMIQRKSTQALFLALVCALKFTALGTSHAAENWVSTSGNHGQSLGSRRPNSFQLSSSQAGSTTDIDNLRVVDLDTGTAIYSNGFASAADATNNLNNYYWPQGGQSTTNFVLNGPMTQVVSGKLRLQTTGFNANGSGGYESHSEAEWASTLPRNFLVEFEATRLQWAGHFHFHLFRKEPSDALGSHMIGGAMSATRSLTNRQDVPRMAASGSWFQGYGLITNWNGTQGWAVSFPAPGGNLQNNHRLGMSISNTTLSFYLNGNLLSSTNIPDFEDHNSGSSPVITSTNSFSGTVGGCVQCHRDGERDGADHVCCNQSPDWPEYLHQRLDQRNAKQCGNEQRGAGCLQLFWHGEPERQLGGEQGQPKHYLRNTTDQVCGGCGV